MGARLHQLRDGARRLLSVNRYERNPRDGLPVLAWLGVDEATPSDPRRSLGALGERLAREHLARSGYAVVESNFRCRRGEIDVVAFGHGALVFCEVKTRVGSRAGPESPLDGIGPGKRRRLRLLAREWLCARKGTRPVAEILRFDAIGVTLDGTGALMSLEHVEGAF